jgi:transcription antitermination factor nusB
LSRRKERIIAFQALYSWDVSREPLDKLLTFSWLENDSENQAEKKIEESGDALEAFRDKKTFASLIIAGTIEHLNEIDEMIKKHLAANWSLERINKVALAILRTSTYEIVFQKDIEPKIVIDEAINIAKDYGSDDSYKFINAVLDKIGKDEESKKA